VANLAQELPRQQVEGPTDAKVLVLGWGGTYGAIATAVRRLWQLGRPVAHAHLRYLNPLPSNLGDLLHRYERVLVPELNCGQLRRLVRGEFLVDAVGLNKATGRPFAVHEIVEKIEELMK